MTDAAENVHELPTAEVADERSVHQRMIAILAELGPIGKEQENAEQGFMFRGVDDAINALNPLLSKHGVFPMPRVLERVYAERQTRRGSVMFNVNLHVEFSFYGAMGDCVTGSAWGEGTDMGDKSTPKAHTGALKVALVQAFLISTKETTATDPDHGSPEESTGTGKPTSTEPEDLIDEDTLSEIKRRIDALPETPKAQLKKRWAETGSLQRFRLDSLPQSRVGLVLSYLNGAEAAARAEGPRGGDESTVGAPETGEQPPSDTGDAAPPTEPEAAPEPVGTDPKIVEAVMEQIEKMTDQEVMEAIQLRSMPKSGSKIDKRRRLTQAMVREAIQTAK